MTQLLNGTSVSDLLEISSGNTGILDTITQQFRRTVEGPLNRSKQIELDENKGNG